MDVDRILDHYEEDFEMSSPLIVSLMGEPSGRLAGKVAIRAYWARALARVSQVNFKLLATLVGVQSVTVVYSGSRGVSAEVLHIGPSGKISAAFAHYCVDGTQQS